MADPGRMVALVREQAEGCAALGSPLYAVLLQRVAPNGVARCCRFGTDRKQVRRLTGRVAGWGQTYA